MKLYKFSLVATIVFISAMASASAQIISWAGANSFNTSDGYTASGFLDGKAGWGTNDPYTTGPGDTGYTTYTSGYTNSTQASGNQNVLFGGYDLSNGVEPGLANSNYSHPAKATGLDSKTLEVTWRFAIHGSSTTPGDSNTNDIFGLALQDASGAEMVRIDFNTALGSSDFNIEWLVDGINQTPNTAMPNVVGGAYNSVYDIRMQVQQSNLVNVDFRTVTIASGDTSSWAKVVTNGQLGNGLNSESLGQVAFSWELSGGISDPGSNYIIVSDITVAAVDAVVVSEPSSSLMLSLGALAFALRRRKR
jgi:hypothetical protein